MPCVACTYMPNASWRRRGGKAQGRGISHPEQGGGRAQRRSAQAKRGRLRETLAPRQGSALSEAWFPYSCASAHMIYRKGVAGRNVPLWRVVQDAIAAVAREEHSFSLQQCLTGLPCPAGTELLRNFAEARPVDFAFLKPHNLVDNVRESRKDRCLCSRATGYVRKQANLHWRR